MAQLLRIAVETFVTERRGRSEIINAGEIAEADSWPVELHPAAFRELEVRWRAPASAATPPAFSAGGGAESPAVSPATLKRRGGRSGMGQSQPES